MYPKYNIRPIDPYVLPIRFRININPKIIRVTNSIKIKSSDPIIAGILKLPKKEETPNTPKML